MTLPHPPLPENPRFYRQLVDHLPVPVVVIDGAGRITYVNVAMLHLTDWTVADGIGSEMFGFIHPDDADWVADSFVQLAVSQDARAALSPTQWATLRFRVKAKDGRPIPVEATFGGGLHDPDLQGAIFTIRPMHDEALMDRVVAGVAAGDPLDVILRNLVEMVALPPFNLQAAVFEQRADGGNRLVTTSTPGLAELPARAIDPVPWAGLGTDPRMVRVRDLSEPARSIIHQIGGMECFTTGAHAPDMSTTLRLVAISTIEQEVARGALQLMERARELMSVVLMKAHNDRLLASEAARDDLTGLPNRLGLVRRFQRITASGADGAMFYVDLDNFKDINDRHGHQVGDRVLAAIADRLRRAVRAEDLVTRIGGDEFAVILSEPQGRLADHTVEKLAERVVKMLAEPIAIDGQILSSSASVGVARIDGVSDLDILMNRADRAMYEAKRAGGARHHTDRTTAA